MIDSGVLSLSILNIGINNVIMFLQILNFQMMALEIPVILVLHIKRNASRFML